MKTKVKDLAVAYQTRSKTYTYADLLELPEDGKRYEIIHGELLMSAAPFLVHQAVSREIEFLIYQFLIENPLGEVFYAPADVVLSDTNVVEPDILFVSNENRAILTEKNIRGAPDLVIEILSPSTAYYDLFEKRSLYEQFGVKEYWIVDPKQQWIEVFVLDQEKLVSKMKVEKEGTIRSSVLIGLELDLGNIFKRVWGLTLSKNTKEYKNGNDS